MHNDNVYSRLCVEVWVFLCSVSHKGSSVSHIVQPFGLRSSERFRSSPNRYRFIGGYSYSTPNGVAEESEMPFYPELHFVCTGLSK